MPTPRSGITPSVRWKVFARDGFRCRYCGAQGGDFVLVVDHVHPVARGGRDHMSNLITACETCNQGKAARKTLSIPEIQTYIDTTEHVTGWLSTAFEETAGVDWSPSTDTLLYIINESTSLDEGLATMRACGEKVREGVLTPDLYTFDEIMRAIEIFFVCVAMKPERVASFWSHLDAYLEADRQF